MDLWLILGLISGGDLRMVAAIGALPVSLGRAGNSTR